MTQPAGHCLSLEKRSPFSLMKETIILISQLSNRRLLSTGRGSLSEPLVFILETCRSKYHYLNSKSSNREFISYICCFCFVCLFKTERASRGQCPSAAPSQPLPLGSQSPLSVSLLGTGRPNLQSQSPGAPRPSLCPGSKGNGIFSVDNRDRREG